MTFSCFKDDFFQSEEKRMSPSASLLSHSSISPWSEQTFRQMKMASVLQQGVTPQHTPLCSTTNIHLTNNISRLLSATALTLPTPRNLFALPASNSTGHGMVPLAHVYSEYMGRVRSSQDHFLLTLINCVFVAHKGVAS